MDVRHLDTVFTPYQTRQTRFEGGERRQYYFPNGARATVETPDAPSERQTAELYWQVDGTKLLATVDTPDAINAGLAFARDWGPDAFVAYRTALLLHKAMAFTELTYTFPNGQQVEVQHRCYDRHDPRTPWVVLRQGRIAAVYTHWHEVQAYLRTVAEAAG